MTLEGTSLPDTISETAFFAGENARCLSVIKRFGYKTIDATNRDTWGKGKNVLLLPENVLCLHHASQCKMSCLYENNTRVVKEVNL